jgi:membrane-bound lytic murein transglycosylase B
MKLLLQSIMLRLRLPNGVLGLVVLGTLAAAVDAAGQEPPPVASVSSPPPFNEWLAGLRTEALTRGIRPEIVDQALNDLQEPHPQILERDRTQAEFTLDLGVYLKRRLTRDTIRTAQRMLAQHRTLLEKVGRQYGVHPRVIVAVWGLESNFGRFAGVRPTVAALATLAYDPRRSALFRQELFNALEILDRGDVELDRLKGSWAGALGQPQFMPSSYLKFAQDFDEDGRRDIWTSHADVFASVAYYLQQHGWTDGQRWGREVTVPSTARRKVEAIPLRTEGCRAERLMTTALPLDEWRRVGVRTTAGGPLPRGTLTASLVPAGSRYFLVYGNYEALLDYNCAHNYALSIGLLSERIK